MFTACCQRVCFYAICKKGQQIFRSNMQGSLHNVPIQMFCWCAARYSDFLHCGQVASEDFVECANVGLCGCGW